MNFENLKEVVERRRSVKPALMDGKQIDDALIRQLLQLADWAPTHAHTEPWRFIVFANEAVRSFCYDHAELYKAAAGERWETAKYEKILHNGDAASHIIAVYMKRSKNAKLPAIEEVCAVAAAVQNILLGATALDIAVLWSTGGLSFHPAMKEYFSLSEEDQMIGFLFLGYRDALMKKGKGLCHWEKRWNGEDECKNRVIDIHTPSSSKGLSAFIFILLLPFICGIPL